MSNIKINDVFQRIQYAATLNQTQFAIPFPFFANAYVYVWQDGVQIIQGGGAGQYGITGAGSPSGGQITLVTPATAGSIITIEGIMPIDRTSIYSATISNLTGSDLNGDFNREVVMMKQIETTQALLQLQYRPWALISQDVTVTKDRYIPLLLPNQVWAMNDAGTEIIGYDVPSGGGIAPDDATYILQVADSELPNAQAMGALASGLVVNTITTGVQLTRLLAATANQLKITNASGVAGNPTYGFADNARFPGTEGLGIIAGTTAQRPVTPAGTNFRFNSDLIILEYWDGSNWVQISETDGVVTAQGTANQVLVNGTSGAPVDGAIILTLPQDIALTSIPTFAGVKTPSVIDTATSLPIVGFSGVASAANYIDFVNAIAGGSPDIRVLGSDTNIDLTILSKGTGLFAFGTEGATAFVIGTGAAYQHSTNLIFPTTSATRNVTFQDASGTLAYLTDIPSVVPAALTKTDDTNVTLTLGGTPSTALLQAASLTMGWTGLLSKARGGTSVSSATIAPASLEFSAWDTNLNLSANNFLSGFATTVSAAGTTTLTVASPYNQEITGSTTQTVQMPVTSTLVAGHPFKIINNSSGSVTINSSGGNAILVMAANTTAFLTCVLNSGTTAASWNASYVFDNGAGVLSITGTANQVIASASTGAITLSLPQSIATTSDVTFQSLAFSDYTKGILGTSTNNNAATGYVGEVITSTSGSTSLAVSTTVYNLTSISLTAGDYDIYANQQYSAGGATATYWAGSISTTSATNSSQFFQITPGTSNWGASVPYQRLSLSGTTTVYLVSTAGWVGTAPSAQGTITARRRR